MTGHLDLHGATGDLTLSFWYRVVRLWKRPVEELLSGGIGILPLAPLAAVATERVPDIIHEMEQRSAQVASRTSVDELWSATYLLLGLRYDQGAARDLLWRVAHMRESTTYQAILEEGRDEGRLTEARRNVLDIGSEKFSAPNSATTAQVERITDLGLLH